MRNLDIIECEASNFRQIVSPWYIQVYG